MIYDHLLGEQNERASALPVCSSVPKRYGICLTWENPFTMDLFLDFGATKSRFFC